jgi:hypothetical protein
MSAKMPSLPCALMLLAAVVLVPVGSNMAQLAVAPAAHAQAKPNVGASQRLGIGREARPEEVAGWDIDIRPDGEGLPTGKGTVKDGGLYSRSNAPVATVDLERAWDGGRRSRAGPAR